MRRSTAFGRCRGRALASALFAVTLFASGFVAADPPDKGDEDTGRGTARVRLGEAYAVPFHNGERWPTHIFEENGRLLLLEELVRSETYSFELNTMNPNLEKVTLVIGPDCWRLQSVRRGVVEWRCEQRVTFPRATREEPPPAPPQEEPDDFEIPPMPGFPPPPPRRTDFDD